MRCPTCKNQDLRSCVFFGGKVLMRQKTQTHYNEDGNLVTVTPGYTQHYECSNSHSFQERFEEVVKTAKKAGRPKKVAA